VKPVIAILGGSTPFTAALIEALRPLPLPACELRLFGQDAEALQRMQRYGARRLPSWAVRATERLGDAASGALIVLNQIRFGGMQGRARDEALANRFQLPADETLGPCGLTGALRVAARIRELGAELGRLCPQAWVLNLANPLSVTTSEMIHAGAPAKTFGLCELPQATVGEACRLLQVPVDQIEWQYAGLNHRGFVFDLRHGGEPLLPRLQGLKVFGIGDEEMRQTGALPLKYFRLKAGAPNRADFLTQLKDSIAHEIDAGEAPPKSLSLRTLDWYTDAVAPMMSAILSSTPRRLVVNCLAQDGLVRETPAQVSREGVSVEACELPAQARPWLDRWTAHERAMLEAVRAPSPQSIEAALALDPIVPSSSVRELSRAIVADHVIH
jgi:6-phospho-beta-glucosidase